jgi:hypothetical protein
VAKVVEYMQAGDDAPNISVIVLTGVGRAFAPATTRVEPGKARTRASTFAAIAGRARGQTP